MAQSRKVMSHRTKVVLVSLTPLLGLSVIGDGFLEFFAYKENSF